MTGAPLMQETRTLQLASCRTYSSQYAGTDRAVTSQPNNVPSNPICLSYLHV